MGRKTLGLVVIGLAMVVGTSSLVTAQSSAAALQGAWAIQSISSAQPPAIAPNKPIGLIQFSGRNYSIVYVSNSVRPNLPEGGGAKATADQLNAIWGPLTANAGTFTVTGNTLRTTVVVAKNPAVMAAGNFNEQSFTLNGDTLVLTQVRNQAGPVANPTTLRLTRVKKRTAAGSVTARSKLIEVLVAETCGTSINAINLPRSCLKACPKQHIAQSTVASIISASNALAKNLSSAACAPVASTTVL